MHLDGADNHVGIGTTTPQQKLTVRGATLFSAGDEGSIHGTEFNWVKSNTGLVEMVFGTKLQILAYLLCLLGNVF